MKQYFIVSFCFLFAIQLLAQSDGCETPTNISNLVNWCSAANAYSNTTATSSGYDPATCWTGTSTHDVWFQFTAIASAMNITVNGSGTGGGSLNNPMIALYAGNCGSTINEMECTQASTSNSGFTSLYQTGLQIGQIYMVRIDGKNGSTGTFQLCFNNFTPPVSPGSDCTGAAYLCNKNTISMVALNGAGANTTENNGTCLQADLFSSSENNSVWYSWTALNTGSLTFTLQPNLPGDDLDFVVYELPNGVNSCNTKVNVRCCASWCLDLTNQATGLNTTSTDVTEGSGCVEGQDNWVKALNMQAGKTYALVVNNYTDASVGSDNGFSLSFGGTGEFTGPTAAFTVDPLSACLNGNTFTFTNNSVGATSLTWHFGEGASIATSTATNPPAITYSTPGDKTIVLSVIGNGGCEVVDYHQIHVEAPPVIVTNNDTTICIYGQAQLTASGGTAYSWSPATGLSATNISNPIANPTQTTTYTVTVTNNGCTATKSVIVTVQNCSCETPPINFTIVPPLCPGNPAKVTYSGPVLNTPTYNWNFNGGTVTSGNVNGPGPINVVFNNSGTHNISLEATAQNGLIVCSPSDTTISFSIPESITAMVPVVDSASCYGVCDGQATVSATGGVIPYIYNWQSTSGNGTGSNNVISSLCAGSYSLSVADQNGCKAITNFEVFQPVQISYTSTTTNPSCYGKEDGEITVIAANGTPPYTYLWSNQQNGNILSDIGAGSYSVVITDFKKCSITAVFVINDPPQINVNAPENKIICIGETATLTATGMGGVEPYTYHWSNQATGSQIQVSPTGEEQFWVYVTDANGCQSDTDKIFVNIYPSLSLQLYKNSDTICPGDAVMINFIAEGGNGGPYSIRLEDGTYLSSPYKLYPTQTTTYTVILSDNCGTPTVSQQFTIVVLPLPPVAFYSEIIEGCQPLTVQFHETSPDEGQTYVWDFGDNDQNNLSTAKDPIHTFYNFGFHNISLTVISLNGCSNYLLLNEMINVFPKPIASFEAKPFVVSVIDPNVYFFNYSIYSENSIWIFGDGDSLYALNPKHTYPPYVNNFLVEMIAISDKGCKDTVYKNIMIRDEFTFYAPTAFTPDKDGINELFSPVGVGINPEKYHFLIYDRWGELIYETKTYAVDEFGKPLEGWNGRIKNNHYGIVGSYTWIVFYEDLNGNEHQKSGVVTLVR